MRREYPADATLVEGEVELRVGAQEVNAANPLPVTDANPDLPAGAATAANQAIMIALLQLIAALENALGSVGTDTLLTDIASLPSVAVATRANVAVAAADTQVLVANPNRQFAVFVNDSAEEIYLALSDTAAMNQGIRLNAEGGAYEINLTNLYTGEVSAICASGGMNLTVTEG